MITFLRALALLTLVMAAPAAAQSVPQSRPEIQMSFAPIAKAVAPAVVNVYTRKVVRAPSSPLFNDPFFRRFFGDSLGNGNQERIQRSLGSGVIVDPKGLVVTNHHVIAESDAITIVLNDRREFEATVVGDDERTDIAVLKIDTRGEVLPALAFGDSDALEVGDLVLAIGNPFGVGQTVTSGIVSAVARTNVGITDFQSFIQTDAAINPGNSGGALVDMAGRLVGINTAIYSRSGGSNGIGFAIPTSMVRAVLAGFTHGKKLVRPWLGASVQPIAPDMAAALKLPRPMGVLVNGLHVGGPGDKAGLRVGDIVVAVNGRQIDDEAGLRFRLATLPVGEQADVAILRSGAETRLTVALVAPPEDPPRHETELGGRNNPFSGLTVANLNPALADQLNIQGNELGVIVTGIRRGSIAQRLNFRPGDLLLKVNDRTIKRVDDMKEVAGRSAPAWRITLKRDDEVNTFVIER